MPNHIIGKTVLNEAERYNANVNMLGRFLLIPAALLIAWFPGCQLQPAHYSRSALEAATRFIEGLASDTLIPLTVDNQPVTRVITNEEIGRHAAVELNLARPSLFRKAWGAADVEIVVISNFGRMSEADRQAVLGGYQLRSSTLQFLMEVKPMASGCDAYRYTSNGWSNGGIVLVDPAAPSMASTGVDRCVMAGFDYQLGVPPSNGTFDVHTFPDPTVSLVVLDYLRFCASTGKTGVSPPQRSNHGVTNFPSVRCIANGIGSALKRSKTPLL